MELNEYQRLANQTDQQPDAGGFETDPRSIMVPLLGMAGEVGELLGEHKKWLRDGDSYKLFPERVKEELGDLLWYLTNVTTKHALSLEDVANYNLAKTRGRWQSTAVGMGRRRLFDEDFPPEEQLPRQMDVSIEAKGPDRVVTLINGKQFGHSLSDNHYEDDGYRFHDVFHLSYATILGWSPTIRALLKRKRKSRPKVDEVEDGGRALVIEEGIASMVFSYAERRNFLEGAAGVNYELLRTIKDMTSHLEVGRCTEGEWEQVIMAGFDLWRQVRDRGNGKLSADLETGSFELVA
jgi:NTP pyrophosphatase (non-canonical NTP hydrolase)